MASIKYRFPDDPNKKWNNNHQNTFTNLSEKYEIQENDELIINNNSDEKKVKSEINEISDLFEFSDQNEIIEKDD